MEKCSKIPKPNRIASAPRPKEGRERKNLKQKKHGYSITCKRRRGCGKDSLQQSLKRRQGLSRVGLNGGKKGVEERKAVPKPNLSKKVADAMKITSFRKT